MNAFTVADCLLLIDPRPNPGVGGDDAGYIVSMDTRAAPVKSEK